MPSLATPSRRRFIFDITVPITETSNTKFIYTAAVPVKVVRVRFVASTAGAGGALQVRKCVSGTAPGSGLAILAAAIELDPAPNVPITGALGTPDINRYLKTGDSIGTNATGSPTGLVGNLTLTLETY